MKSYALAPSIPQSWGTCDLIPPKFGGLGGRNSFNCVSLSTEEKSEAGAKSNDSFLLNTQHSVHSERSTERLRPELAEGSRRSLVELHSALSTQEAIASRTA